MKALELATRRLSHDLIRDRAISNCLGQPPQDGSAIKRGFLYRRQIKLTRREAHCADDHDAAQDAENPDND